MANDRIDCEPKEETPLTATQSLMAKLIDLDILRKQHEEQIKRIKDERVDIVESILDAWIEEGVDSMRVHGVTLYMQRSLYASARASAEDLEERFAEAGLAEMVKRSVNANSLAAYVREIKRKAEEEGDTRDTLELLPSSIREIVSVCEKVDVRTRGI